MVVLVIQAATGLPAGVFLSVEQVLKDSLTHTFDATRFQNLESLAFSLAVRDPYQHFGIALHVDIAKNIFPGYGIFRQIRPLLLIGGNHPVGDLVHCKP